MRTTSASTAFTRLLLALGAVATVAGCNDSGVKITDGALSPTTATIQVGKTQKLSITLTLSDGTTADPTGRTDVAVTWASSDAAVATVQAGTAEATVTGVKAGSATITATAVNPNDQSQIFQRSATITVTAAPVTLTGIEVTPTAPSLAKGTTQALKATGRYSDQSTNDITSMVTWSSETPAVATVASTGVVSGLTTGTSVISAALSGQTGTTTVTVTAATLRSVAVTPATASLAAGANVQLTATGTFSDNSTQDVTSMAAWTSSAVAVATVSDAAATKGRVTGVTAGMATISAAVMGQTATATVTVTAATLSSIAVTPTNPSIAQGTTRQFTATGTYSDNSTQDLTGQVTWASGTPAVATVTAAGLATGVAMGTSSITATLGAVSGNTTLTVTAATLTSIAVTPNGATLALGRTQQFTATGTYSDNSTQNLTAQVTWTSATVATATISNAAATKGLATSVAPGTSAITASLGAVTSPAVTLTVTAATLVSIAVTPGGASIPLGRTQQFTATGTYSDNTAQNITSQVTWASATAATATISNAAGSQGLATSVAAGTSAITATLGAVTSPAVTLTVTAATLVSIAVTPNNASIPLGRTQQFTATGTYSDSTTQNVTSQVTWASATAATATISNAVGSQGLATSVAAGTSAISASLSGVNSPAVTLTVTAATLVSIAVTPNNASIPLGRTQQFTATGTYTDNTSQNITGQVTWASATAGTATISNAVGSQGLATSAGAGTSAITARLGAVTSPAVTLTVTAATLVSIAVTPNGASIALGRTQQFTATGTYTDNSTQNITEQATWTSATPATATVSNATGTRGLTTSVAPGTSAITAALAGVTSPAVTLTVTAATLVSIAVSPSTASIALGRTQQFTATGTFSNNSTQDLTASVTWASATQGTATISNAAGSNGLATSAAPGTTQITATLSGVLSPAVTLTVTAATLQSLSVTPASASIALGRTQQFTATGTFSNNTTQDLTTSVNWVSGTPATATISNAAGTNGLATSAAVGTTSITATLGGVVSPAASLAVTAATLVSISVSPPSDTIARGTTTDFTATGRYSDNSTQDLTALVTWSATPVATASINNTAPFGRATGNQVGTATVSAQLGAITSSSATLTVTPAVLASIVVTPALVSIPAGLQQAFSAQGIFTDGSSQDLTSTASWSTSDGAVATVSSQGVLTGIVPGTVNVVANSGTITGSVSMTVNPATLTAIQVSPAAPSIPLATGQQFTATGTYSNNQTFDITDLVTWGSSAPLVAPISNAFGSNGRASGIAQGSSIISATLNSVSNATTLTVTAAALVSIAVEPATNSFPRGTQQPYTATGTYTDGTTQDLTFSVAWSTNNGNAVFAFDNVLEAANVGTSTVSAQQGSVTGTAQATVTAAVLVSIFVEPSEAPPLPRGTTRQFQAFGVFSDGSSQDVTGVASWTSAAPTIVSVDQAGLGTAANVGNTTVTATIGLISGSESVSVSAAQLVSIAVTPGTATIPRGTQQQFVATGTYTDNSTVDLSTQVDWSSSSVNAVTVDTVGLATGANVGASTITAAFGSISGTATLNVSAATLVSISVTPPEQSYPVGLALNYAATGTYTDSTTQDITDQVVWTSSQPGFASISNAAGNRGRALTLASGATSISAAQGSVTGSTALTVNSATLVGIGVSPEGAQVPRGTIQAYSATGVYSNNQAFDLTEFATWGVVNTTLASISNAPANKGVATGLNVGDTQVFATYQGVTGTANVTISAATLVSIAVTPNSASLPRGLTRAYTATGTFTDNTTRDITNDPALSWSSSAPLVATVSNASGSEGVVTGVAVNANPVTITAQSGAITATATVTITSAVLTSLQLSPPNSSLPRGFTQQFTATGIFSDGSNSDFTTLVAWSSSNTTVATISNAAGSEGSANAANQGSTTIVATAGSITASTQFTVTAATLQSIAVTGATGPLPRGLTRQYIARGTFSDGTIQNLANPTWGSTQSNVATISSAPADNGLLTAVNPGTSNITAAVGMVVSPAVTVTVSAATLVSLAITPAPVSIAKGFTRQFTAIGTYTDSTTQDLTNSVTWEGTPANVVFISNAAGSEGLLTALNAGAATVTASSGGITSNVAAVTVTNATLVSITITPANPNTLIGQTVSFIATGNYSDSTTQNLTTVVTWTSSNTTVAAISNVTGANGLATALTNGSSTITAQLGATTTATTTLQVGPIN